MNEMALLQTLTMTQYEVILCSPFHCRQSILLTQI